MDVKVKPVCVSPMSADVGFYEIGLNKTKVKVAKRIAIFIKF